MDPAIIPGFIQRLSDLGHALDATFGDIWESTAGPYWVSNNLAYPPYSIGPSDQDPQTWIKPDDARMESKPGLRPGPPLSFSSIPVSTSCTFYWALKIILLATNRQIANSMRQPTIPGSSYPPLPPFEVASEEGLAENPKPSSFEILDASAMGGKTEALEPVASTSNLPLHYTKLMLRSIPYSISPEHNAIGPQRCLFPLRVALFLLRLLPIRAEENPLLDLCKRLYAAVE